MAVPRKFGVPLDLSQLEIQNVRLQQLGSDPGSPVEGQLWYRSDLHRPRWRDNSVTWDIYPSVSTNTANTEVLRDGSGNFSAGTITAALTGTASQATTLDDGTVTYRSGSYYLSRTNHTGTQLAATISNLAATVQAYRLDQFATPTANVSFGSINITNLADPVNPQDAATKAYVDARAAGLDPKESCRALISSALPSYTRTGNVITASANGALAAQDGVTLVATDRVLFTAGVSGSDNGIYVVTQVGTVGTPFILTRSSDANTSAQVTQGMFTFIGEGTTWGATGWILNTTGTITLNATSLNFVQFTGTGDIIAGNGISKSGNTLSVNNSARLTFTSSQLDLVSGVIGTPGTYTSVTIDTYGRTTAGADIITSNGLVVRTGAGTFAAGTITGTANRITVTGGTGTTPTIDIHASYVGQSTITTLGTIGTGVWQGTAVGTTYGGTGLDTHLAANGTLLIGNASGFTLATLTQGAGITITNGTGSITIAATATIGGSIANTQVGYGSGSNTLTSSAGFTYVPATGLTVSTGTAPLALTQSVATSGSPNAFSLVGGAHTTLTASTEAIDVLVNLARTVQFAQGALTTQRAVRITAPTYAFATGGSTLTKAATFAISGAPAAGTNATLTNSYALWVEAGLAQFDGTMVVVGATTHNATTTFNTASSNIVVTQGVATSGSPTSVLVTGAAHTTLTASAEAVDVNFALNRTVQFAQGALTTQRAVLVQAPTYAFATSASTLTNAATFAISGAPAAGTNATITNSYALWVQGGISRFDGNVSINDAVNVVLGTTTGTKFGTSTSQKLGFFNATPVVQQTGDITTALSTLGLVTSGTIAGSAVTGTVGVANGGTGVNGSSAANGTLLIGNGSGYTLTTLTQGANVTITNGSGTITIAATGTIAGSIASTQVAFGSGANTINGTANFTYATATGLSITTGSAPLTLTQSVQTSGSPTGFTFNGGAHTTLTASTEATDFLVNTNRIVQFAQGALATQRAIRVTAPTYAFATGASTLTTAATVSISGSPIAGTNATITNSYALWVESGKVQMDGTMAVAGASTHGGTATFNTAAANIVINQGVGTSGSPTGVNFTGAAHTTLTASAEAIDINWNLSRTVQFAQGALTTQRAFLVSAPTYAFATGASTLTNAATFAIAGAPVAGTNATITNSYSLWVQGGTSRFDGTISINDAINVVLGSTTGTKFGTSTSQKLGFFNATPVVQQTGDISTALSTLGLVTSGTLAGSSITGTVGVANGGTGVNGSSAANGALLIGNGSGYTLATLTAGSGISITNGAGTITIATTGVGTVSKYATSFGNGSLTAFTITHSLGSLDVVVQVYDNSTGDQVECGVTHTSTSVVTLNFSVAPTTNQYRVVVTG